MSAFAYFKLILVVHLICYYRIGTFAMENAAKFVQITSCTCLGYVVTFECTVGRELGTVWSGSVFDCSSSGDEIQLFRNSLNSVTCNNGMITGKVVRRDDSGFYTSQVSIIVSSELIGRNVSCAQDDGDLELIGSATIILTTKAPYKLPQAPSLISTDLSLRHVTFTWTPVAPNSNCPDIHYDTVTSNCGSCPTTTNHTTVTCVDIPTDGSTCAFAVRVVICGNVTGNISNEARSVFKESQMIPELIGGIIAAVLIILLMATIIILSIFCNLYRCTTKIKMSFKKPQPIHNGPWKGGDDSYSQAESGRNVTFVKSSFELSLPPHLIIPSSSIKLNEIIGQGEFGVVYKGYIKRSDPHSIESLAIKTLKGFYDHDMVNDMLKECSRMLSFDHVHVLTVKGVCLDGGAAPYIIMPFMANGSLLAYLKKNRKSLVISSEDADREDVEMVRKRLMDMCSQVGKGMEYLAKMKVVHRDLAARNCMIDYNFVIKVADFGLSVSVGVKEYFRQDDTCAMKLPLKWLPPESMDDHIFSEKSDVWAYGVTCWEIFSGGKVPYAELMVREIPKLLEEGYRLEKPSNDACSEEMYSFMHQCWSGEPEHRPSFTQLVESLSSSLEEMAGYVHIGAFGQSGPEIPQ